MTIQFSMRQLLRFPYARFRVLALAVCAFSVAGLALHAQAPASTSASPAQKSSSDPDTRADAKPDGKSDPQNYRRLPVDWVTKTYYLHHTAQQNDANEVLVALRNMLAPWTKLYLVTSQNAIVVQAPPDQQQLTEQLIHDLDRPKQTYKLTYTLTESDAGKRVGVQHFSLLLVTGQRTTLKEGSKIPLMTGTYSTAGSSSAQQQFQYIDVGMNFDAMIDAYAGGVRLRFKVEQSSTTEDKAISGIAEPVIRQTVLEGVAILAPGKPTTLGTLEVPGTTRRIDVEVTADLIP